MRHMLDAFWRAVAYCMHPRVIGLSMLPLALMTLLSFGLGYFFWQSSVQAVELWLSGLGFYQTLSGWLSGMGLSGALTLLPASLVLMLATPAILVVSLLLVAAFMTSAMAELVAQRRFPSLERKRGGSMLAAIWWSLVSTVLAVLALLASMPLWLIPPLILVLPPLIWGWLTYRVFAFDSLAAHASREERQTILKEHRGSLLAMGVLTGYLGAAPSLLWASGALFVALAPVLVPLAIWIYTLVFALASLWFSHFTLSALEVLRSRVAPVEVLDPQEGSLPSGTPPGGAPQEPPPALPPASSR
ncbi:MAG: EI24 domain-containing protein [Hydrogenophaga sp.]|nr:EI24 domain-containing protein [Hydrogenophaga sp.]